MAVPPPTTDTSGAARGFLVGLGAPQTPEMLRAVQAWLRQESGGTIRRNNPWNLHQGAACGSTPGTFCARSVLPGQTGVQYVSSGDKNVAVFDTLAAGSKASAQNLLRLSGSGDPYRYGNVVRQAQAGSPEGFLNALAESSWSAGRYKVNPGAPAGGSNNKLLGLYRTGDTPREGGNYPAGTPAPEGFGLFQAKLTGVGIDPDPGHVITKEDTEKLAKLYGVDPRAFGDNLVGRTVNDLWGGGKGIPNINFDPVKVVGEAWDLATFFADPKHWVALMAVVGGGLLMLVGGFFTLRAAAER